MAAGFQPGDALLAINGVELNEANKEAIMKTKKSLVAGSQVSYTVLRQGAKKTLERDARRASAHACSRSGSAST